MQRALHVDAKDQYCAGQAGDKNVQTSDHTEPQMDLEERPACEYRLWPIVEGQDGQVYRLVDVLILKIV
jgi:hypothetical protein